MAKNNPTVGTLLTSTGTWREVTFRWLLNLQKLVLRPLKLITFFILIFFVFPISLRAALLLFEEGTSPERLPSADVADMTSTGLLPAPESYPAARVLILEVPTSGYTSKLVTHSYIILKRENARSWDRFDVMRFASRDWHGRRNGQWFGNEPIINRYAADGRWYGVPPVVIADAVGAAAAEAIPKIEAAIKNYPVTQAAYRVWPGPNSNTFVAVALRAAPELKASLPPTAIGKDFKHGLYVGLTDTRTGVEASLYGILGLKIGWAEGVEINFLTLIAGFDARQPALKIPGFGRIDLVSPRSISHDWGLDMRSG